ncbi:MAG TPA: hypothetical protein VFD27_18470 [Chthoniobacteraceae bacterium]|nr:hypothetical protein [Chthoniobacteraceae bacterium]
MTRILPFLIAALAFAGCGHHVGFHSSHVGFDTTPKYAQPSVIPIYGTGPWSYTVYYGSDAQWHYFESHRDVKIQRYKVPRSALPSWQPVAPVRKVRLYVDRNARGELYALPPKQRH